MTTRTKLAVILHADVVGSTRLVQLDERLAHDRMRSAFEDLAAIIRGYKGIAHEVRGDALVAEFERPSDAVTAALAFQASNATGNEKLSDQIRPVVRIGIALGEVVVADDTLTGAGVVLAQRLEQLANGSGVCISAAIREALPGRLQFAYQALGEQPVKGFDEPVRAFLVNLEEAGSLPEPEPEATRPASKLRERKLLAVILVLAAAVAAAWFGWFTATDPPEALSENDYSIAVIPFSNRSESADQAYFSQGISEDIATDLTRLKPLSVTPTDTVSRFVSEASGPKALSQALSVRYVLTGSVRRSGNQLRISAQLYDARASQQIWAERYDRGIEDLFAVQDDISAQVVGAISTQLELGSEETPGRRYTPDVRAYDLYIRGRATRIPPTPENLSMASDLFEEAIKMDPDFAGGYAGAAFTQLLLYAQCIEDCDTLIESALRLARKAVNLDAGFGPAHGTLAEVQLRRGEFDEALAAAGRAVEVAPNDSLMLASYGRILGHAGRYDDGIKAIRSAIRLSPDSLPLLYYLGSVYRAAGRFEEAIDVLLQHRQRLGGRILPAPTAHLAAAYMQAGQEEAARAEIEQLAKAAPAFSLEQAARSQRFKDETASMQFLDALRRAGLRSSGS